MKKVLFLILLISFAFTCPAQIGFVNTKLILNKMPEYQQAERLVDQIGIQWQREIDNKQTVLNRMSADYESERALLSDDMKKAREENLAKTSLEIRELQRAHFGLGGDLSRKEDTLIRPLREKINEAIQRVAASRRYSVIMDKSEGTTVMYADNKLDITEDVIRDLGIK